MKPTKALFIILFLLSVFSLSYLKNTFVINFFSSDYDLLIPRFHSSDIYQLDRPLVSGDIGSNPRGSSVIIFHILFALVNSGFIYFIFRKMAYQKIHWLVFGVFSLIIGSTYGIYILAGATPMYEAALILKDFLQSAVYSFLFVIVALNYRHFIIEK